MGLKCRKAVIYKESAIIWWYWFCVLKSEIVLFTVEEGTHGRPVKNKLKNHLNMPFETDCSLLSSDSPSQVASVVGKCRRPAALMCVIAQDIHLPSGKHLDQRRCAAYCARTNQRGPSYLELMTAVFPLVFKVVIEGEGFICHSSRCFHFFFIVFF